MKKVAAFFLLIPGLLAGQKKDQTAEYQTKYPDESAVYLSRQEKSTIRMERGVPVVYTHTHEELLLLADKVTAYSERKVYYSSFSSVFNIKGLALNPNAKGKYSKAPVKETYVTNEFSAGSFYDDYKAKNLVYTGLVKGSRMLLDYQEKLNDAHFFGRFYFSTGIPVENSEFTVVVPAGVVLEWKLFNIKQEDLEFKVVESGTTKTYTWKKTLPEKYRSEDDDPGLSWYAPHVVVYIKEYKNMGKTVPYLDGPQGLYNWYYTFIEDINKEEDPALRKIVDTLVNGATSEFEKVTRIYYWVQDNIKYVAFEDGMGGFIPRDAHTICDRRYGDCKDMSNITCTMLRMAGIQSYITWIGTRSIPYRYADVPCPMSDNHMICTYIVNGTYYFLDATGKNTPIGTPTSMIQGKEALISKGEGAFEIVTVPVVDAGQNTRIDSVFMTLAPDGFIHGTGSMTARGFEKIDLVYPMDAMNEEQKLDFISGYLEKGSNKFHIDTLSYANLYDRDKDLHVKYNYTLGGYAHANGSEMYVNLCLDRSWVNSVVDTARRTSPYAVDYKNTNRHVTVLTIPAGWSVSCLPQDLNITVGDYSCTITYRNTGNQLICEKVITVNTLMITADQFLQWNEFSAALTAASNENVTLSKTAVSTATVPLTR
jgi:hypothetical protein